MPDIDPLQYITATFTCNELNIMIKDLKKKIIKIYPT